MDSVSESLQKDRQMQELTSLIFCASVDQGEAETLKWMIEQVESVTDVPVSIGSPSTEVLVEVYRFCNKPGLF